MGFSLTGLIFALIIFAPNILMLLFPPKEVPADLKDAGIIYTVLERAGQIGCILLLCLSANLSLLSAAAWLICMLVCICLYYGLWLRYVMKGRSFSLLFRPLGFIPIPMAIFPVLAFTFAALAGLSIWLGISTAVLAIGHLANSWHVYRQVIKAGK